MASSRIHLGAGLSIEVPLSIGTLQWGTTTLDQRITNANGCIRENEARNIVRELVQGGNVTLFDTAEGYGGGTSEKRLGRVTQLDSVKQVHDVLLMTKFLPTWWRYSHSCFESALRESLKRMGVGCCPIYLLHSPVHWRPIEYWVEAAAKCKEKGLLKAFGLSNCNAEQVRRAHAAGRKYGVPVVVNQVMYNLLDYNSTELREMEKACNDLDVKIIAYSPIGQGLLTDSLTPEKLVKNRPAKMTGLTWDKLQPLRECIRSIAQAHDRSMAQVCINWCIQHNTIPLVGCRSVSQAQDTLGALGWELTESEVRDLDEVALARSTLESPTWRRALFVQLAGVFMVACSVCDNWLGRGMVEEAR